MPLHTWVLGPSGVGKSTVLHNIAAQIMDQGLGLVLIEPKGDLAKDVLYSVPNHRANDVIWFDPADTQYPIGLNVWPAMM
jgi:type IV secretory pathway VirB4 component